jgi:uncharacterized damage-inducible protein DinB
MGAGGDVALVNGLLQELEQEAQTTRRLLARVPNDRLSWRPHPRSRSLGELAMHIAVVPGAVARLIASPSPAQAPTVVDPPLEKASDLVPTLDASIATAKEILSGMDDAAMKATWRMMNGQRELLALPRFALLRAIMLNHWYHHRGQLTVYLRELNVAIPSIYGPTADENPFGDA